MKQNTCGVANYTACLFAAYIMPLWETQSGLEKDFWDPLMKKWQTDVLHSSGGSPQVTDVSNMCSRKKLKIQ